MKTKPEKRTVGAPSSSLRSLERQRGGVRTTLSRTYTCTISLAILPVLFLSACSKDSGEKEPAVPVQVVTVKKETIQRTVTAEAILFPLQQAAITPKISAPVKTFYVKRGSRVHKGQLLAVLENTRPRGRSPGKQGLLRSGPGRIRNHHRFRPAAGSSKGPTGRASRQTTLRGATERSTTAGRNFFSKARCLAKNSTRPEWI